MKWTRRWSRAALGVAAGAVALGVGTVAAQSGGEEPWWTETGLVFTADGVTTDGSVVINSTALLASGSLLVAKNNYPETGEYIGCSLLSFPDNGQFVTCTARDAEGATLHCEAEFGAGASDYTLREQTMMLAIASISEESHIAWQQLSTGECFSIIVSNSSADFLASEGGGTGGVGDCDLSNSVNIGAFGGSPVSVPNDGCAVVTQFAKPYWTYGPNRTMQLQNTSGTTTYPLDYEYAQACSGANGSGTFNAAWHDQFLPGMNDQCPLFIKLQGNGAGNVKLSYF